MTIHATLNKLPGSQSQWSMSIDTHSVLTLAVPSPLDRVLYAEVGTYIFSCLEIQTSCYLENHCRSVLWQRIIQVRGESFPPGGVISASGVNDRGVISASGVNDREVIHASDTVQSVVCCQDLTLSHAGMITVEAITIQNAKKRHKSLGTALTIYRDHGIRTILQ